MYPTFRSGTCIIFLFYGNLNLAKSYDHNKHSNDLFHWENSSNFTRKLSNSVPFRLAPPQEQPHSGLKWHLVGTRYYGKIYRCKMYYVSIGFHMFEIELAHSKLFNS